MTCARASFASLVLVLGVPALAGDLPTFDEALRASAAGRHGEAAAIFHDLAESGDPSAAYNLAVLFATGRGLPQNEPEALFWAWRARLEGSVKAGALVARLSEGLRRDRLGQIATRLDTWARPRADAGDGAAMLQLVAILSHARPAPDDAAAYAWAALAAALDVPGAVAARDQALARITPPQRQTAQDGALQLMQNWCAGRTPLTAPVACHVVTTIPGTG